MSPGTFLVTAFNTSSPALSVSLSSSLFNKHFDCQNWLGLEKYKFALRTKGNFSAEYKVHSVNCFRATDH